MKHLLRVEKFLKIFRVSLPLLLFFLPIFLSTCSSPPKNPLRTFSLTQDERVFLKEFFRDLLFKELGVYTLIGTKPVSIALIQEPLSEQEQAEWNAYIASLSEKQKSELEQRKTRYDFSANYKKWEQIRSRFPMRQYLFGTYRLDKKTEILVFVNIEMTLRTLLKHYEDFRRILGLDFDPLQVVFEVSNKDSLFWNTIITKDHALLGILLGYGVDNAWFFEWKMKNMDSHTPIRDFVMSLPSIFPDDTDEKYPDPAHFETIPFIRFGLYPSDHSLLTQYSKEKAQIKSLYKGNDEVDVALHWLTR